MTQPILKAVGLSKKFGGVQAVDCVSLHVHAGEMVALIGPNGAGKSTFFNLINGQLQPDQGEIFISGQSAIGLGPRRVWQQKVGRTFQMASVFNSLSVIENMYVAMQAAQGQSLRPWGVSKPAQQAWAMQALEQVSLQKMANQPSRQLAYADIKRLELAMVLVHQPRVLLMDEPTAGMTYDARHALMQHVKQCVEVNKLAVLFTEHSMDVVFGYADRIVAMAQGRVLVDGDAASVKANLQVQQLYFGGSTVNRVASNRGTEQPSSEQPSSEQPSSEQPSSEQPSTEQPSSEQPSSEQPSSEQPSSEQPSTEQPSSEQPDINHHILVRDSATILNNMRSVTLQPDPALSIQNLTAGYSGSLAIYGVSLHIMPGEVVGLMGHNGAGKSTLLKTIMGIIKPYTGTIKLFKQDISHNPIHKRVSAGLGFVPEDRRIFTHLTVLENLAIGKKLPHYEIDGRPPHVWSVEALFELFPNLASMPHRLGGQMSGGEQQMLAVARTLMGNPRVLLLDEPSEGVAPIIVEQMLIAVLALKKVGLCVLLSEQNAHFAQALCDRVYHIQDGHMTHPVE